MSSLFGGASPCQYPTAIATGRYAITQPPDGATELGFETDCLEPDDDDPDGESSHAGPRHRTARCPAPGDLHPLRVPTCTALGPAPWVEPFHPQHAVRIPGPRAPPQHSAA